MAEYKSIHTGAEIDAGITRANGALLKSGGTMTGALYLNAAPSANLQAATKKYVDDKVAAVQSTPGADGISPIVSVTAITGGHQVTITDAEGTKSFNVMDGKDGSSSGGGTGGADGVSPIVSVAAITGGHRVTITDAEGSKSFDVMDGSTPVRGTDYWTAADIAQIKAYVDDAILGGAW